MRKKFGIDNEPLGLGGGRLPLFDGLQKETEKGDKNPAELTAEQKAERENFEDEKKRKRTEKTDGWKERRREL